MPGTFPLTQKHQGHMTDTQEAATSGNGEDLRADIQAAMAQVAEADLEAFGDEAPAVDPKIEAAPASAGPERDESGRFKPKQVSEPTAETTTAEALPPILLPKSWDADKAERFNSLPRDLQEYLVARETERDKFVNQKSINEGRLRKFVEPIHKEIEPYAEMIERAGMPVHEAIGNFFRAQERLDANPREALAEMAAHYGLQVQFADAPQQQQAVRPQIDPGLQRELREIKQWKQQWEQSQAEAEVSSLRSEVSAFANEKDAQGQPLRPHFEAVWSDMLPFLDALMKANPEMSNRDILQKAYKHALADNDAIAQAEAAKAEAQKIADAKAKTANAKRAGSSIGATAPGGKTQGPVLDDLRSTIRAAMRGEI